MELSRNPPSNVNVASMAEGDWFLMVQLQDDKAQKMVALLEKEDGDKDLKGDYKVIDRRLYRRATSCKYLQWPVVACCAGSMLIMVIQA